MNILFLWSTLHPSLAPLSLCVPISSWCLLGHDAACLGTLLFLMSHRIIKLNHSGKPKNSAPCVHSGLCRNVHVWMSESHALTVNVIHPLFNDTIGLIYLFCFPLLIPLPSFCRRTQAISSSWDAR